VDKQGSQSIGGQDIAKRTNDGHVHI